MNFLIVSHTSHIFNGGRYYAYGPYVKEMNLWLKNVDSVEIVAPLTEDKLSSIILPYKNKDIRFSEISTISLLSFTEMVKTIFKLPEIFFHLFRAMKKADHIHLRCPGNIGLLGCISQVFFPKKKKTAKYAGNWEPTAKQPWSYRLQKWILSNTFLTRNMKVLVYGEWPEQSKNILPFFTASYSKEKIVEIPVKNYNDTLRFVFVGTLAVGKRPLYALHLVGYLREKGIDCRLDFYGEGDQRESLEKYINEAQLVSLVTLHGNQSADVIETAYKQSHFLILASQSEGWPKVVAEAMFWGVVPLVTPVSCVPWMLEYGNRGIILTLKMDDDVERLLKLLKQKEVLKQMAVKSYKWSHQYTLEVFEAEIKKLI